jgi:tetratricopeptide (TPR) repeat protein
VAAGSAPPPPARFDASTDPKNLIAIESRIDGAITRHRKGDVEGGVRALRAILKRHPRNAYVYSQLAYMLAEQGKHAEAVELLSKAVSLGIAGESMKATLALGLVQTGKARTAWELLSPRADSRDPETQVALGTIAAALGRAEEARARFERALALDPTYPSARVDLAVLHVKEGRFDDAKPLLERALAENPYLPDGWNALGAIRARQGDLEGALDAWERAVKINPRLPQALFNIAVAAEKIGETERALSALERFIPLAQGEPRRRAEAMLQQLKSRGASP